MSDMDVIVWGNGSGHLVLENSDAGLRNSILQITSLNPADLSYSHVDGNLIFTSPAGDTLTIKDTPLKGNPFHIQYFEQTGEWFGDSAAQTFEGVAGRDDYFAGNKGDDVYRWGAGSGNDTVNNWESDQVSSDIIEIVGLSASEVMVTGEDRDLVLRTLDGESLRVLNHLADSHSAINAIRFEDGTTWDQADILDRVQVLKEGTDAAETLRGDDTDDVLDGKGGDDTLIGFDGDDTYLWGVGSGQDVVQNWESAHTGFDTVRVMGATPAEITVTGEGRDLVLTTATGDSLRILNHLKDSHSAVDEIRFQDGTVWNQADIKGLVTVYLNGTEASDSLHGSETDDVLDGKGGSDTLTGYNGDDVYLWGASSGSDVVQNWEANHDGFDTVRVDFDSSDVQLVIEGRDLVLLSNTGDSLRILNHMADSHSAIDIIEFSDGSVLNREAIRSQASETYTWGTGSGHVLLENYEGRGFSDNILKIVGLNPSDISYSHVDGNLIFTAPEGDTLSIKDVPFKGNPFHIQYFEQTGDWYGDNTSQIFDGVANQADYYAGNGGDDVYRWGAGSGNDTINNWEADNRSTDIIEIVGLNPSDVIVTGEDRDLILRTASGENLRVLNHLTDTYSAVNEIRFEDGTTWDQTDILDRVQVFQEGTAAAETMRGADTDDVLDGKGGADTLIGFDGDDSYIWGLGSGSDTVQNWESAHTGFDIVSVTGVAPGDITVTGEGRDLMLTTVTGDSLRVLNHLKDSHSAIDEIRFEDGTVWDQADILDLVTAYLEGSAASEVLYGSETDDVLDGKGGSDTLIGYDGDDTYIWGAGSGSDVVQNWEANHDGFDTVRVDFDSSDVQLVIEGRDLVLLSNTGDSLRILNHMADSHSAIDIIEFSDGSVLNREAIRSQASETYTWGTGSGHVLLENYEGRGFSDNILKIVGLNPSDISYSHVDGNLIFTAPEGDTLTIKGVPFKGNPFHVQYLEQTGQWFGDGGVQVFDGVAGQDDYFAGNSGDDTYSWGQSSGNDTINNWEADKVSVDVVEVIGLKTEDVNFIADGRDLILQTSTGDSLRILNHMADSYSSVNEIRFEDGSVLNEAQILNQVVYLEQGTSVADIVEGSDENNLLEGLAGNDILIGGAGDDIVFGGSVDAPAHESESNTFKWGMGDKGTAGNADIDTIGDFNLGSDSLSLEDLLDGESNDNISEYIEFNFGEDTILNINSTGELTTAGADQVVVLQGLDISNNLLEQQQLMDSLIID